MKPRLSMFVAAALLALASNVASAAPVPSSTDEARALVRASSSSSGGERATADARKHAQAMNEGKDHQAAWDATHSSADGERMAAQGRKHADQMNAGKDHQAAWEAADAR
jgi:hypothetical protein